MGLMQWIASLVHHKPRLPETIPQQYQEPPDEDQLLAEVREQIDAARRVLLAEQLRRHRGDG